MKKFLLLALLTIGATSFAGVEGTPTEVSLPVTVKGTVVDTTKGNLIITAIDNTGVDGRTMTFEVGNIGKSSTHIFPAAKFKIEKADNSTLKGSTVAVGVGKSDRKTNSVTKTLAGGGNVTINYTIDGTINTVNESVFDGTVAVNVVTDAQATAGEFMDNTNPIVVKVTTP